YILRPADLAGTDPSQPTTTRLLQGAFMRWRAYAAAAAVAGSLAGCMHEPAFVGDGYKPPNPNDGTPGYVRSQKPDPEPATPKLTKSLLDVRPERPGDPTLVQVVASIRAVVNGKAILDEEVRAACFWELLRSQRENTSPEERLAKQRDILTKALQL